jgi:hypothetical protein
MGFQFQFKVRTLIILVVVVAILLAISRWLFPFSGERRVLALDCGDGRQVLITAAVEWEKTRPVYYRVMVNGKTAAPKYSFYYASENRLPRFSLVTADGGRLAAVVLARADAREVVVLHDFAANDSWPSFVNSEEDPVQRKRLLDAFEMLKTENTGLKLALQK